MGQGATSREIAAKHCVWAAEQGLTPREVMESVGWRWPHGLEPTWDDAVLAVSGAWVRLRLVTFGEHVAA